MNCDPDALQLIENELQKRYRAGGIPKISKPGVYALHLSDRCALGCLEIDPSRYLYVGTSKCLASRNHFCHPDSSFSTLRRSLGAILKLELGLTAIPRGAERSGRSEKDMSCYQFAYRDEKKLTDWMTAHLEYSFAVVEHSRKELERCLIAKYNPPLNRTHWPNPQKSRLTELSNVCRDEAARFAIST